MCMFCILLSFFYLYCVLIALLYSNVRLSHNKRLLTYLLTYTLRSALPVDTLYYVISGTSQIQILQLISLDSVDEHFAYSI